MGGEPRQIHPTLPPLAGAQAGGVPEQDIGDLHVRVIFWRFLWKDNRRILIRLRAAKFPRLGLIEYLEQLSSHFADVFLALALSGGLEKLHMIVMQEYPPLSDGIQ